MKTLLIVRGLPGSGKSRFIADLTVDILTKEICSADDFFMKDGKYDFRPEWLANAHHQCQQKAEKAMKNDSHLVIIDNTNSQRWEMEPYYTLAERYGYYVTEITIGEVNSNTVDKYYQRNNHGVPKETIQKMVDRWEH